MVYWDVILLNKILTDFDKVKEFYKKYYGLDVDFDTRIRFRIILRNVKRNIDEVYIPKIGNNYEIAGVPFIVSKTYDRHVEVLTVRSDPYYALMDAYYLKNELKERLEAESVEVLPDRVENSKVR